MVTPSELGDFDCLARKILRLSQVTGNGLFGIEGFSGSGKTKISTELGSELGYPVFNTDEYVTIRGGNYSYVTRIAKSRLRSDVRRALSSGSAIVEGICLRKIALSIQCPIRYFIYVKRMSDAGIWHDGINLDDYLRREGLYGDLGEPFKSDFDYHERYRPHERANVIFRNIFDG